MHGALARHDRWGSSYVAAAGEIEALRDLTTHDRAWHFEAKLGNVAAEFIGTPDTVETVWHPLIAAAESFAFTELAEHLIESERCTFAHIGRFEVREEHGKPSVRLFAAQGIDGGPQNQPVSSDVETQIGINSWHAAGWEAGGTLVDLAPTDAVHRIAHIHDTVAEYRDNRIAAGHTLFAMLSACLAYGAFSEYVRGIAAVLDDKGVYNVPLVGAFERDMAGRVTFHGESHFLGLLSANLSQYAS